MDEENPTFSSSVTATLFDGSKETRNYHNTIVEKATNRTVFTVGDRVTGQTIIVEPYTVVGNSDITNIIFEEGVTTIAPMAIPKKVESFIFPSTIERIYSNFNSVYDISNVICFSENPPIIDQRNTYFWSEYGHPNTRNIQRQYFLKENEDLTILVPTGCAEAYKQADGWSAYADKIYDFSEFAQQSNLTLDQVELILENIYNT